MQNIKRAGSKFSRGFLGSVMDWCTALEFVKCNTSSPRKELIPGKTPGEEGGSPRNCSAPKPRGSLCLWAKCGTQIFGFAFTGNRTTAGFIIFVLKGRERLCPPKSLCNNNSSAEMVFVMHRVPYGSLCWSHQGQIKACFILKSCFKIWEVAILVFSGVTNSSSEGDFLPSLI